MTGNSVFNVTWDSNASQKGIERAAKQIVDAVEKGTQHVVDVSKNPQKVVDAIKAGSEKIVDAVGKIKNTTNANQTVPLAPPAVGQGLKSIAASTTEMADYIHDKPGELSRVAEMGDTVIQQFTDLISAAKQSDENSKKLQSVVEEAKKAAGWLGSTLCSGGGRDGGTTQTFHVGNAFAALWQRYGG